MCHSGSNTYSSRTMHGFNPAVIHILAGLCRVSFLLSYSSRTMQGFNPAVMHILAGLCRVSFLLSFSSRTIEGFIPALVLYYSSRTMHICRVSILL